MLFSSTLLLLVLLSPGGAGVVTSSVEEAKDRKLQAGEEATCQWVQVGQDVSSQFRCSACVSWPFANQSSLLLSRDAQVDADQPGSEFGFSAAISGDGSRIAVGAPFHDGPFIRDSGN